MGSNYYGELSLGGNGRSGSSRKGKKSNSEKPKQPQRGLGVAQLEKIRLQEQMDSCHLHSLHSAGCPSNIHLMNQMGLGEAETAEFQSSVAARWNQYSGILQPQRPAQASVTQHFLRRPMEDSVGSGSRTSGSIDTQELDLDLKL